MVSVCLKETTFESLNESSLYIKGITRFSDAKQRAATGNFLHVPLLSGSNENEADLLVVATQLLLTGAVVPIVTQALADAVTEVCNFSISGNYDLDNNYLNFS